MTSRPSGTSKYSRIKLECCANAACGMVATSCAFAASKKVVMKLPLSMAP